MQSICNSLTGKVIELLASPAGVTARVGAISEPDQLALPARAIGAMLAQNVPAEIAERSLQAPYPAVQIYCDKLSNTLKEKFRKFSGTAHMVVEIRFSQDRLEEIGKKLQVYVEAVCQILDETRGDWGEGAFYAGGYEADFGPVKQGGLNFLQTAKIGFDVNISN